MTIPILDEKQIFENLKTKTNPFFDEYYALYSSWYGGITKNPHLMLLPIDDHMVHRGDGVFEGIKAIDRSIYLLEEHLERLFNSAEKVSIKPSITMSQLKNILIETLRAADRPDVMIRIFLSRGPGNFSVNPYDSVGSQTYVMIHRLGKPSNEKYVNGVLIGKSAIDLKPSWMSSVKSCNYLPNVLMKKEAVDRQLDFVISVDKQGNVMESATENIMIVNQEGAIVYPDLDYILKGITMSRVCELARKNNFVIKEKSISINELINAREVMMTGTTLDVLPVVKFEDNIIGDGTAGIITKKLQEFIWDDIKSGVRGTVY